jgi:hypothetical protein
VTPEFYVYILFRDNGLPFYGQRARTAVACVALVDDAVAAGRRRPLRDLESEIDEMLDRIAASKDWR